MPRWARSLAIATAALLIISTAFPVAASLSHDTSSFPAWWGYVDVALAFVVAVQAFVIVAVAGKRVTRQAEASTYRAYRVLLHGIFVLMVLFFLLGDRITWINGLPGIAWRSWLVLYALPAWCTAFGGRATGG